MLADDPKTFYSVKSVLDALNLQRDLDMLSSWWNRLSLNIIKCKTMSYYHCKYPIVYNYEINNLVNG